MDEQEDIVMQPARDQNFNFGFGSFTVNNTVIEQKRFTYRYIRGTEEEEAEYNEYHEIKRGDIRLHKMIHRGRREVLDVKTLEFVPIGSERSTFIGEIISGDQKGTVVVVEAYEGSEAPEDWRKSFVIYSRHLCVNNAHLLALTRSKVPLLIFLGGLVPITHFGKNIGPLGRMYVYSLFRYSRSGKQLNWLDWTGTTWVDPARGMICRGPLGPADSDHELSTLYGAYLDVENLPPAIELLEEDISFCFLVSQKSAEVDRAFVKAICGQWADWADCPKYKLELYHRPSIVSALTRTSIAVANNAWIPPLWLEKYEKIAARNILENELTRYQLNEGDDKRSLILVGWNHAGDTGMAWLSQALSLFQSRGISLEGDLSVYHIVCRSAFLRGDLDESPSKRQQRHRQPIYLFLHPLPPHFDEDDTEYYTSSLHFWSLHVDGESQLSPESCFDFGLPVQLFFVNHGFDRFFWNTDDYKRVHEYQLARGFDSTTIDFARHLKFDHIVFQPINNSDRFEELKERSDRPDGYNDSKNLVCTSCGQFQCPASHTRLGELTTTRQNTEIDTGGMQVYHHPEQGLQHKDNPINYDWAMEEQDSRLVEPFPSFIAPVNSHSLESAHPYEGYQSQAHPADDNVNQEDFHHPYLSKNLSGDVSLTAPNTAATIKSNSSSMFNPQAEWLGIPQYPLSPAHFNGPPIFSSSSPDPADIDNSLPGNTTNSAPTDLTVSSFNFGTTTALRQGEGTPQNTGWAGDAYHFAPTANPLDESLTFSSFEADLASLGNGFDAIMMNSFYTEPAHVSSVDTSTGVARYVVPTAQGVESGPSHITPALLGSAGTIDAVGGYPLPYPREFDTVPPNLTVQAHPRLLYDSGYGYTSSSPYHPGGPPERSQEQ
ncbi:hypothetical protein PQX77_013123 [Marasmius sp. AFHP31]|nr:hypothetical protein PQX77_013123 [Marasmius sp. AFHP31]